MAPQTFLKKRFEEFLLEKLSLNLERGQPSDDNLSLSNELINILKPGELRSPSGIDLRNYPGGVSGLPEAREYFADYLGIGAKEVHVGNNSSLELMSQVFLWSMLRGVLHSPRPWIADRPKLIVTVPGYDRHFRLVQELGFELISVPMTASGPDLGEVRKSAEDDSSVKGIFFVPTYSNPTGDTISEEVARQLVSLKTAAPDFTIFADDAYRHHHLSAEGRPGPNLLAMGKEAGFPNRVVVFGSTSKITFASAGVGFMGMSEENLNYFGQKIGSQTIGPNKIDQMRHVRFLSSYPGGLKQLMQKHAEILAPKFQKTTEILERELRPEGLATWTNPKGGYFISFDSKYPVARRIVELCKMAGVSLTPAGSTYPNGIDPNNRNIRLSPTRPSLGEIEKAMTVFCTCVKLASEEFDS